MDPTVRDAQLGLSELRYFEINEQRAEDRRARAVNHLPLSLALPPQEVAGERRLKVKVEEGATERGGDGEGEMTVKVKVEHARYSVHSTKQIS